METKSINVDLSFLGPDNTSIGKYEDLIRGFQKEILKQAIIAGDVKVAIHIIEEDLIGEEDTADSGRVFEEALEIALRSEEVNIPMLEAIVASLNIYDDALEYLTDDTSILKRILLQVLWRDYSTDVIRVLSGLSTGIYWTVDDIEEMMSAANSEGLDLMLTRFPIEHDIDEFFDELRKLEEEIIDEGGDTAEALDRINLIRSHLPDR